MNGLASLIGRVASPPSSRENGGVNNNTASSRQRSLRRS
jgi:hypothetical protein